METLIEKLISIHAMIQLLEDNEKEKINEILEEKISNVNNIVDGIYQSLSNLTYSEEKIRLAEVDKKNETKITKKLFPYYWLLSQNMGQLH